MPGSVPSDLLSRLEKLFEDPSPWWIGQIKKYITRYNSNITKYLNDTQIAFNFIKPIVGLHIRRSDKVSTGEGIFIHVDDYMEGAEEFFDRLEIHGKVDKRRVYIATDTPSVIKEIREKYPHYEVISNVKGARIASNLNRRSSFESLKGIMVDMHLLTQCDFVVCTFSSNIGRTLYELMQTVRLDASNFIVSLDAPYLNFGEEGRLKKVVRHNEGSVNSLQADVGDIVLINRNRRSVDPLEWATNLMTDLKRPFPGYKGELFYEEVDFFNYSAIE